MKRLIFAPLVSIFCLFQYASMAYALDVDTEKRIIEQFKKISPKAEVTSIEETSISGLYEVILDGVDILYVSSDGLHFLNGNMYKLKNQGLLNLTEQRLSISRVEKLKSASKKDMIVYSPEGETKRVIYAFTDVDCGYCKRFHQEVPALNKLGIEVRYLAWPRSGLGENSITYQKMKKVWCSKDPHTALTETKLQNKVPQNVEPCETGIPEQLKLGFQLGVKGTPALFTEDGRQVGGYRKAKELARALGVL